MFRYYLLLGLRSLRRNPALTTLMILTLAIGVAASVATLTILHVMSGDPIPHKSDRLFVPLIDIAQLRGYVPGEKEPYNTQTSYTDAVNYLRSGQGVRRTVLYEITGSVEPPRREDPVVELEGIAATADFFPMFEVPFRYGQGWSAAEDERAARVVVLSRARADTLFGEGDPVGKRLRMWGSEFTVVGVVDNWNPVPRYTNLINGSGGYFRGENQVYVPFRTAVDHEQRSHGSTTCNRDSGVGYKGFLASDCIWITAWFELASASDRAGLKAWLDGYAAEQRRLGRIERPTPTRLFNVMEWMGFLEVVRPDNKLAVWLSFGFLLLCIVNTMGLLLAKFSTRAAEVGVRRALGAGQGAIFRQFLTETAVVGLAGGFLGLVLAFASLALIRQQSRDLSAVAHMDWKMLAATFVIAVGAAVVAGLLPTWRACQVSPALQLKSQ
ncbi:MAG TPA: ABC transporter permease [Usitatibacter sp.]|nr:ABC transporter permease [Usitatibacter sp.]